MAAFEINEYFIYKWRYYLGYGAIGLLLVGALIFAGLYVPGGISNQEVNSVITSSKVSLDLTHANSVLNLPFYLLQRASLHLFGVSTFSIKLPSLVLGFISAIGMVLLLRRWFPQNIAILSSTIAITTSQFIFIAQSGTTSILYVLWPVWLLYLATLIANRRRPAGLFKILFAIGAALSLYTPLSIYPLIALSTAILLHPHLRFIIRQLSRIKLLIGILVGILLILPLVHGIIEKPTLVLTLLGLPSSVPDIGANGAQLWQQFFGFANPSGTTLMTPLFGLGSLLLILLGLYQTVKTRVTAKSYVIFFWLLLLIPVVLLRPIFTSVTFLPLVLLLATGLGALLGYWYRLFPRNPYARIAGLVPIVILVASLLGTGVNRYVYGYHYDPNIASSFSQDLDLLPSGTKNLVVTQAQVPFYDVVAKYSKTGINVTTVPSTPEFTATHDRASEGMSQYSIARIVTSSATSDGDRFYIYKK